MAQVRVAHVTSRLDSLHAVARIEVVRDDALEYLARVHDGAFDIVLADPPYALGVEQALLRACRKILDAGGVLVLQHHRRWQAGQPAGWRMLRQRRFRDTVIDFFVLEESEHGRTATADGAVPGDFRPDH